MQTNKQCEDKGGKIQQRKGEGKINCSHFVDCFFFKSGLEKNSIFSEILKTTNTVFFFFHSKKNTLN